MSENMAIKQILLGVRLPVVQVVIKRFNTTTSIVLENDQEEVLMK